MSTVLIVDDDADICALLSYKLRGEGHDVHVVTDGETGLARARELRPDVILLDWMMPRLSGLEATRALRDDPVVASTPILLLTARAQERDIEQGFAAGADDYVTKPFSIREVSRRVAALLGRS